MTDPTLEELADRLAIQALLYRYARMVDFRQWELFDQVFAKEATCDYVSSGGIRGPAREVMDWLDRALAPWPTNIHAVTNLEIEFEPERRGARSTCYFVAPMARGEMGRDQLVITNSGLYVDRLRKTEAGWRIVEREMRMTIMQGALPEGYAIPR
ncbi:MAG: nuclear transport factor 2 family protein [Myxococcota bacterium]